jgi:Na+/H+ antiporter NhaD/arsenite permease-like protein
MRKGSLRRYLQVALLAVISLALSSTWTVAQAGDAAPFPLIIGRVLDHQGQPVVGALVTVKSASQTGTLSEGNTQADGRYAISLPITLPDTLTVSIERTHFKPTSIDLDVADIQNLRNGRPVVIPDVILLRRISLAFWIASIIFIAVLVLIATGTLHNTLSALAGAALIFTFSYLGRPIYEGFFIFDFYVGLSYVDWNVIFLIMGMMIIIAVIERTGVFQWLAFMAYRVSGGRTWLLVFILMVITAIVSAFLDNVTTMMLMTPISIQIALALGINPLALLMPEVMASNIAGISTLIGTPTNILIGSYGEISFSAFLINLTPGVVLALIGLVIYCELIFRKELKASSAAEIPTILLEKLAERARITTPDHLKKAGWVGAIMLVLFIFGERINLLPAVTAIIGATALMIWIRPDIDEMIEAVDWTTLVFFIALFIVVGAIQEVGLVSFITDTISRLMSGNLLLAMLVVIWMSALLSTVIANIPFTAAMLPVIGYLTATVPGADTKALFYCLSVGSAMGGNGSLIGASANMVTAGIAGRAGYPITYVYFFKKCFPALLITVGLATVWLLLRF